MSIFIRSCISGERLIGIVCLTVICMATVVELPLLASDAPASVPKKQQGESSPSGFEYHIGPGDVLQINVWKEPEASVPAVTVRSDGFISVPLLKEVPVCGLTPSDLEKLLTKKLSKLIRDADVTVVVKEIHSEVVYLIGGVKKEGPIPLQAPITVLQAIAQAGGLTDYAKRNKIYVLRQVNDVKTKIPFNYSAVLKGEHMDSNISLLPGDTIIVPQ